MFDKVTIITFIHLFIYTFIHCFIHSFIHLFIHLLIYSYIRSFTARRLSTQAFRPSGLSLFFPLRALRVRHRSKILLTMSHVLQSQSLASGLEEIPVRSLSLPVGHQVSFGEARFAMSSPDGRRSEANLPLLRQEVLVQLGTQRSRPQSPFASEKVPLQRLQSILHLQISSRETRRLRPQERHEGPMRSLRLFYFEEG